MIREMTFIDCILLEAEASKGIAMTQNKGFMNVVFDMGTGGDIEYLLEDGLWKKIEDRIKNIINIKAAGSRVTEPQKGN